MSTDILGVVGSAASSYTVSIPLLSGIVMVILAFAFSTIGMNVPAGVSGAIAVFFVSLGLVGSVLFWLLGRIGR